MASRRAEPELVSPYDPDARYREKHGKSWRGYKVHLTETCSEAAEDDPVTGCPAGPEPDHGRGHHRTRACPTRR